MTTLPTIAGLWFGSDLSWLEQVVLQSYLDNGHRFVLYTVDEIAGIPDGIEVRDAREIYYPPPFDITDNDRLRVAVFSDIFRLHMIRDTGFIWVDLDAYCVRPFDFSNTYVFGTNPSGDVLSGVLALPEDALTLTRMLEFVTAPNPVQPWRGQRLRKQSAARVARGEVWGIESLIWGCSGPKALTHFLKETGEISHAVPTEVFYPVVRRSTEYLVLPNMDFAKIEQPLTKSVHVFGFIKKHLAKTNKGLPPRGSYLAHICARHGIDANAAPIPVLNWMKS